MYETSLEFEITCVDIVGVQLCFLVFGHRGLMLGEGLATWTDFFSHDKQHGFNLIL
jgi:hypothetical protein